MQQTDGSLLKGLFDLVGCLLLSRGQGKVDFDVPGKEGGPVDAAAFDPEDMFID